VLDNNFGEDAAGLQKMVHLPNLPLRESILANKQTEDLKCRSAILILEKQELVKAAHDLITETGNIAELKKVNADAAGFRRRSILAEMFAFLSVAVL
jgi:hypothetical protein